MEEYKLTPDERVQLILTKGADFPCDETSVKVEDGQLPEWYDETKFKRGQKFFHDNIFVMFFAKLCGLMSVLSIPTILRILIYTNMSSNPMTAYRRYMATIYHMCVWYDKDFKPGSILWRSIVDVQKRHFSASVRACKAGLGRISQKDIALTQFGFMGFIITKPKVVGIYNATEEELEGFVHVWRVVGYLLGIDDKFNICRDSVEETKKICHLLSEETFAPAIAEASENTDFKNMAHALINGLSGFNPVIDYSVFMNYLYKMCNIQAQENNNSQKMIVQPSLYTRFWLMVYQYQLYLYQFYVVRKCLNWQQNLSLFIIKTFPFIPIYRYGFQNAYVSILNRKYP